MRMDEKVKVALPEKGIVRIKSKERTYIYYTTRAYRNANGKPTSDRVMIGKLDEESGQLIPNRNYFEVYLKTSLEYYGDVKSCGLHRVFSGVAKQIGLEKLVKAHFPEKYEEILTMAEYMLSEGNVMNYLPDWQEEHRSYSKNKLNDTEISRIFQNLPYSNRQAFFSDWIRKRKENEYIAYDVTSISSYSRKMESLEWGYNRDKEQLPQINLAMYYGEESMLPLYYRIYPGSITDKSHLKYMTEEHGLFLPKKLNFVVDRGFYSAENLQILTQRGCRFMIAMPNSLKLAAELIDRHRSEIVNRSECRLGPNLPYGKKFESTTYGFRMNVHLYYSPEKALKECENFYAVLDKQQNELQEMELAPAKEQRYEKYFHIYREKDGSFRYERNFEAIDAALSRMGFFIIAETCFKKTTAEVLETYRRRDVVEKCFDNLKNDLDMKRLHTHSDETTDGKAFVAFIALTVLSKIRVGLKPLLQSGLTYKRFLLELQKIKVLNLCGEDKPLTPLTRLQRDILQSLELPSDV